MKFDVVCVGQTCMDVLIKGVDLSTPFDKETKRAQSTVIGVGGDATNQSIVLSRLGVKSRLVCGVGGDEAGMFLKGIIEKAGVDVSRVSVIPENSTFISIVVIAPDGQRNFIGVDPFAYGTFEPDAETLDARIVSLASLMIPPFTDVDRVGRIVRRAKGNGSLVCADVLPFDEVCRFEDYSPVLPYIDFIFPNEDEGTLLTGKSGLDDVADAMLGMGVKNVIIKTGKRGCFLKNSETRIAVPTFDSPVLDTTGAGDNFAAGFMTALLEGRQLPECCRMANAVASVAVQSIGANTGVKNRAQVEDFLATHKQYQSD
jgi:sugar/nucleoside kinase (ribokinase family)